MIRIWVSRTAFLAAFFVATSALGADDQTKNAARELARDAGQAYEAGDFERAQDLYHRAYALVPAPTLSLREARALEKLGRLVEAVEAYVRTSRTKLPDDAPDAFVKAVAEGKQELARLHPRLPKLRIDLEGAQPADVTLKLDGKPLPPALVGVEGPVNPGSHKIEVTTPAGGSATADVNIAESETKSVTLRVEGGGKKVSSTAVKSEKHKQAPGDKAGAESDGSLQRTLGFVSLGVGGVGLGLGVVTGLMATSKHSSAEENCPDKRCVEGSSGADDLESFRSLRTVSTIGYVVGAVGIAGGTTLLLTAPSGKAERTTRHVSPFVGVGAVGVRGRF